MITCHLMKYYFGSLSEQPLFKGLWSGYDKRFSFWINSILPSSVGISIDDVLNLWSSIILNVVKNGRTLEYIHVVARPKCPKKKHTTPYVCGAVTIMDFHFGSVPYVRKYLHCRYFH